MDDGRKEAVEHVKDAARSTLLAVRSAVDAVLGMLDRDDGDERDRPPHPGQDRDAAPDSQDEARRGEQ